MKSLNIILNKIGLTYNDIEVIKYFLIIIGILALIDIFSKIKKSS